ncbi:MAG: hypothetical protein V3T48_07830, partial [Vicinamibacterales bacterium]
MGNTLALTYNDAELFPHSRASDLVTPILPNGAIGVSFDVSSTLAISRAKVEIVTNTGAPDFDFGFGNTI